MNHLDEHMKDEGSYYALKVEIDKADLMIAWHIFHHRGRDLDTVDRFRTSSAGTSLDNML